MLRHKSIVQITIIIGIALLTTSGSISIAKTSPQQEHSRQENKGKKGLQIFNKNVDRASGVPRNRTLLARENRQRVALIVGNSNYSQQGTLSNPKNDAEDMDRVLTELGFDVIKIVDADKKTMDEALENFALKLSKGGVGLFYYAGHGIQVEGENYLIPVDAKLNREKDVNYEALPVGKIQNVMEDAETDVNIIILDACRNNPFTRRWNRSTNKQGLAQINASVGSFVAFATSPGQYAEDGNGRNGVFTSYLLKYIKEPNLGINDLFDRVRQDVSNSTDKRQVPWVSTSLIGKFSFNSTATSTVNNPPESKPINTQDKLPSDTGTNNKPRSWNEIIASAPQDNLAKKNYFFKETKTYLESGGDPNAVSNQGFNSLHIAVAIGSKELIELALAKGANIESRNNDGATALFGAIFLGNKEIIAFLLDRGANIDAKIEGGGSVIHSIVALANKGMLDSKISREILELLITRGANINAKDNNGMTGLHYVINFKNKEILKILLSRGADVNIQDNSRMTALHLAAAVSDRETVEMLLEKGANINAKTNEGWTPLDFAVTYSRNDLIQLLKQHGAVENIY